MTTGTEEPSGRIARADAARRERLREQRALLRPLGWALIAVVAATTVTTSPAPGLRGVPGILAFVLITYAAATAVAIGDRFVELVVAVQVAVMAAMGLAGVGLVVLQPRGATGLAVGAAVWMAMTRLPLRLGLVLGIAITAGQDVAAAIGGSTVATVVAATLFNVLLGLVAHMTRAARVAQDRTELLLAQLADAREEQTRAAALAERSRIAAELHDVLAHSLSGAAIQLQAARLLAAHERGGSRIGEAVDRASNLVNDGLANARAAVGALRGEAPPGVADLPALVDSFRRDLMVSAELSVQGPPRAVPAETGLLLYRGTQEALTNVARYAANATTSVVLRYDSGHTSLSVENGAVENGAGDNQPTIDGPPGMQGLPGVGGGHGIAGLRERVEAAGGSLRAGPHLDGWRLELELPA